MTYRDRPVFPWSLDWQTSQEGRFEFEQREVAAGFGAELIYSDQEKVVRAWTGRVWLDDLDQIEAFDAFTAALQGRLIGFWFPAPQAAFEIVSGVSGQQCDIAGEGFAARFDDQAGAYVWLTKDGQTPRGAKVVAVALNGDGTTRLTFEEAVAVDGAWQAWDLAYVRLADDAEEAEFIAEQRQVRRVQVVELPLDYAEAETGTRPVFLYHLWVGEGESQVDWYWTSFALDLADVDGHTYLARRITHGSIQYDTTGVRQGVQIEVERAQDSPFALLFPPYGCQPLNLEIQTAEYPDLENVTTLFRGVVASVQADGKSLRARCNALGGGAQSSVPAFYFSARCQYRVFDIGTCGLARVAWQNTVRITALNGRDVTVVGASLTGLPANWFAEGWLEVGSGLTREVRLILTHPPESATTIVLTLNAPLRFNGVDATATLVPGCDGRWVTCESKFSNTGNYGGHRFALRNLAIKALDIPQINGGKK